MVPNKHKESVLLFVSTIFPWCNWILELLVFKKGENGCMWVKKKNLLKKGREPTTESTQTSHCLCESKYEVTFGGSECFHHYPTLVPYGIHVSKYPVYNKVLNNK